MTAREKQELAYHFAFWPDALNSRLHAWKQHPASATEDELEALDNAARLHLPPPEENYASFEQIERLTRYQALSCLYRMRSYVNGMRKLLGRPEIKDTYCSPSLLADVAIPGF